MKPKRQHQLDRLSSCGTQAFDVDDSCAIIISWPHDPLGDVRVGVIIPEVEGDFHGDRAEFGLTECQLEAMQTAIRAAQRKLKEFRVAQGGAR